MSGVARFEADLQQIGFEAEQRNGLVIVTLDVELSDASGPHQVATDPPNDYPAVPPHWLHLRKELILTEDPGRASELGDDWWKWSRAHPNWKGGENAARLWLAHARSLLLVAKPTG